MAYLENIINRLESTLKIHVHGTYHARAEIDSVLFWNSKQSHAPHPGGNIYIYVMLLIFREPLLMNTYSL